MRINLPSSGFWRPVPDAVRDAYVLAQYERLARQVPLLYIALIFIMIAAATGANPAISLWIRQGIPVAMIAVCMMRLAVWLHRPKIAASAESARRMLTRAKVISGSVGAISSVWCVYSWESAATPNSVYFPLFMAMGALATVVCVSMSRSAAMINILTGLVPITLTLLLSGDRMAAAAGASIGTTCTFLLVLVRLQHMKTVELLLLQRQMRELADTDPLTGLMNRRALQPRLDAAIAMADHDALDPQGPVLMLLDLDGFKPVNDNHGHSAGDEVLREVARRLSLTVGTDGEAYRLGGDEFAVLIFPHMQRNADAIGSALLASLARPHIFERCSLHVGASLGTAHWPRDGQTLDALLRTADRALYSVKSRGRGVGGRRHPVRNAWVIG